MKACPYLRAAAVYPTDEAFMADLQPHLVRGFVRSTPTCFVMGRPVASTASADLLNDPWHVFSEPDAWFVWLCAGDMLEAFECIPFPLPLVGFARFGQPARFHGFERMKELACNRKG